MFTKNKALFNQGSEFVSKYVTRNVSWEIQKAIAIQSTTTAMTELGMGVVQAALLALSLDFEAKSFDAGLQHSLSLLLSIQGQQMILMIASLSRNCLLNMIIPVAIQRLSFMMKSFV